MHIVELNGSMDEVAMEWNLLWHRYVFRREEGHILRRSLELEDKIG